MLLAPLRVSAEDTWPATVPVARANEPSICAWRRSLGRLRRSIISAALNDAGGIQSVLETPTDCSRLDEARIRAVE